METKASETITENIFRSYYGADTFIEKSAIPKEFGFESKKGSGKDGYPDFFLDNEDFVIIVEAKTSKQKDAENDVLFYMEHNKIDKDMLGIAVSGQTLEDLQVSYFKKYYGDEKANTLNVDKSLMSIENLKKIYKKSKFTETTTEEHLNKTLHALNKEFQNENIVRDTERSLFFSGLMIALKDKTFRNSYKNIQEPSEEESKGLNSKLLKAHILNESIVNAITRQLKSKVNNLSKEYNWKDKFSFIKTIDYSLSKYKKLIKTIEENIFIPFENEEKQDILGRAYKIFLSKAGKVDNKNIIITPDHIKSLMVKLADLNSDDVVLDTCTGSGGFLMESMETLIKLANGNEEKIEKIKEEQLIGFENDSVLFALACSNMFLHGDGRTNLIYRSSILYDKHENIIDSDSKELYSFIKSKKPTKVIINPPYEDNKSIDFTIHAIKYLEPNGKLIIIMPTPTLTHNQNGATEKLLKMARLDFVIRMPEKLFTEQKRTVNTSIFGFTKTPHNQRDSVLFYNLEDDGFVSIQHKGRVDKNKDWNNKEQFILDCIRNKSEIKNFAEKRFIYKDGELNCAGFREKKNSHYEMVKIGDLFNSPEKGSLASEQNDDSGEYDFITASSEWKKHSEYDHDCEALIYAVGASGSLGRTHYVNGKFIASNLCIILRAKNEKYPINLKFYKYYLESIREQIRADLADGTSKLTINLDDLMEYYIEYIPYNKQNEFYQNNIKQYENLEKQLLESKGKLVAELNSLDVQ